MVQLFKAVKIPKHEKRRKSREMPGVRNRPRNGLPPLGRSLGHIGNTRHQEDARIAVNPVKKNLDNGQKAQKKPCFRVALPPVCWCCEHHETTTP